MSQSTEDTTQLINALRSGEPGALDRLVPRVYEELQRIAHRELARRGGPGTLRTTGVLHEAYVRLVGQSRVSVEDRAHFLALAARTMRHVIIDYARGQNRQKRGGGWRQVPLHDVVPGGDHDLDELIDLHDALDRLERFDPRLVQVVECRFFGGMSVDETAAALKISSRTVDRAWQKARAWLYQEVRET